MAAPAQIMACPLAIHQHTAACYNQDNSLACGMADFVVHTHNEFCYKEDSSLVCQLDEIVLHEHSDACFGSTQELTCELDEDEVHTHGEDCYESTQTLICVKNEIILHSHSSSCRDGNGNLICGMLEVAEHVHSDGCFTKAADETTPTDATTEPTVETTIGETTTETTTVIEGTDVTETPIAPLAAEVVASGTCGEGANWVLTDDGALTISGNGNMSDYSSSGKVPWYSYRSQITSVIIESGITTIGSYAFYSCSKLTSITIPNSVTSIGEWAFYYCGSLTSISIPSSVTSIGEWAFSSCTKLASITISDGITSIGDGAFENCSNLTSITLPDSITSIGYATFSSCKNLSSIALPNSITSIGDSAFNGCHNLTNITIPDSVTSIGNEAFRGCSSLSSITVPDGVTSIGNYTFYNCGGLTSITLPYGVTSIGNYAFSSCSGLTSITLPDSVTSIGDYAFSPCSKLTNIVIPEGVSSIGNSAFSGCSSLTDITLPSSVTSIGASVFSGCSRLAKIEVDANNQNYCSVDGILYSKDKTAFLCYPAGKTDLQEITIPGGVTSIGDSAFNGCKTLTRITLPNGVTSIGNYAFNNCDNLTYITLPNGVTSVGSYAFYGCDQLTNVTIPNSVTAIGSYAFSSCYALTSIIIPDSVTSLGSSAFSSCNHLTNVTLSNSITSIEKSTFYDTNLTRITIPSNVTFIGERAFYSCDNLTGIIIENGQLRFDSQAFYGCTKLKHVTVEKKVNTLTSSVLDTLGNYSEGITEISFAGPNHFNYSGKDYVFGKFTLTEGHYYVDKNGVLYRLNNDNTATLYYCPEYLELEQYKVLSAIPAEDSNLPYAVTAIGDSALKNCNGIKSVAIPNSVAVIEQCAFQNCDSLTEVTLPSTITRLGSFAFCDCNNLASVNGETVLSAVVQSWAGAGADISTFQNTALSGSNDIITTDAIMVEVGAKRTVLISTPVTQALTGEKVQTTLAISKDDTSSTDVIRIYFQFVNEHGSIDYTVGPNDFEGVLAEVCETNIPYTYYIEFKSMPAEQELTLDIPYGYQKDTPGGTALIWVTVMSEADAQALGNGVSTPKKAHRVVWATRPDAFQINHAPADTTVIIQGDGTADGAVTVRDLQYNIDMCRVGNTSDYGKDQMVRIDYVATLSLPDHFNWKTGLIDSILKNDWYAETSSSYPRYSYYVRIGETPYLLATVDFFLIFNTHDAKLVVDDTGNVQLHWSLLIPNTQTNLTEYGSTVAFGDDVIVADAEKLSLEITEKDSPIDCVFSNSVTTTQHFTYSGNQAQQSVATKVLTVDAADSTVGGSLSNTHIAMGESTLFKITLSNTDPLPQSDLDYVTCQLPDYFYITPAHMEAMFRSSTYGKDLSITITNATICTPLSHTVTGTDGQNHVITQQYEGKDTSHEGKATTESNECITRSNATLTLCWSEDKSHLEFSDGNTTYEISPSGIQEALDSIGYVITSPSTYTCTWDQVGQTLYSGESRVFQLHTTPKSTFMRLTGDTDQYITSNQSYKNYIRVYAYAYTRNGTAKNGYSMAYIYRDFTLANDVYLNETPIAEDTLVKAGDVLTYQSTVTRRDGCSFNTVPLVSNLEGAQLLLVSAADNPSLADKDLKAIEVDGDTFYILNKAGQYSRIKVGNYLADRVEIQSTDNGVDTMIYWYLSDVSDDTTITAEYQALVSPEFADVIIEGETYTLSNEVWLNDHQTHRLYDNSAVYATVLAGMGHNIVTNLTDEEAGNLSGHDPSKDVLATQSTISAGQTITYRLMLDTGVSGSHAVHGSSMFDALPPSLDSYWSKDNITVTYIPAEGSSVEIENGDSWYIETDADVPSQQYLRWNDDFSATINGTLYIYVTLTYPMGTQWSDYYRTYGSTDLLNTFHLYNLQADVSHLLFAQAEVLLQKDVQNIGVNDSYNDVMISRPQSSLWFYTNDAQYHGLVTYSISLYNGGDVRIYLSDIQDVLPEGFTFFGLCSNHSLTNTNIYNNYNNSSYYASTVSVYDANCQNITFKKANINATCTTSANNQQVVTFSLSNSGYGNLGYDEQIGKYYLNSGEAVVIAYHCRTNGYGDTKDTATSIVSMPFFNYNGAGVHIDTDAIVDRQKMDGKDSNNGNRLLSTNSQVALWGMNTNGTDSSTNWLASEVTVYRGSIQPGITKTATSPFAYITDPITWSVQVSNSGTDDLRGYTLTDVMMKPYQFAGTVRYQVDYDYTTVLYAYSDNLFTFGPRTAGDDQVTITYGNNKSTVLTINGDYQEVKTYIETKHSKNSTRLITIWVKLGRDANGNEVLSIFFPEDSAYANIPAHGSATLTLQTQNFSSIYSNASFFNTAYITPSTAQSFDSATVSQGSYTVYEGADSVVNESSVAVSYGYYTPSGTAVAELSDLSNSATSNSNNNYIVLDNATSPFRYTLTANNTGGTADSKAMDLLVLINNLPQTGDHSTLNPDVPRFSEFQVNFCDEPDFTVCVNDTILSEESYTLQFSKMTEFGKGDLDGTSTNGWYTLAQINADATLSMKNMRSFRVVIQDDTGTLIPGDAQIAVSFNAKPDLKQGNLTPFATAWNSFGYHYSLVGNAAELSASSQKVGVRMTSIPCLTKELQNSDGSLSNAKVDTPFRFVVYEGSAIPLPELYTPEDVFTALANSTFTIVELTVKAGESASDTISLSGLYCYRYENGTLEMSDIPWVWKNSANYTLLELPSSSESIYQFGSFNRTNPNNYTFAYDSSTTQLFTCFNVCNLWDIQVQKLCQSTTEPLSGAFFGLYSPVAVDSISVSQFEAQSAQLSDIPQKVLQIDGSTWYLVDIQATDDNGCILWNDLVEQQYYLLELQAPNGYLLNEQPGQIIQSVLGETATVAVTNAPSYDRPDTGNQPNTGDPVMAAFYTAGAAMTGFSFLIGYRKKRKPKNKADS